jgi:hypothetical protein
MTPPPAAASAVQPRHAFAPGRPLTTAPRPRRVSGPARRPVRERPARRSSAQHGGIALGLIDAIGRLSEHRLLDRLIRGRVWIGLVAFALIGIVTLQLGLLKLNAGIGHALQRESSLQRENAALSIENSELAAGNLVESSAVRTGMEMVPVGALRFLTAHPRTDVGKGAAALNTPLAGSSSTAESASAAAPAAGSTAPTSSAEGAGASSSASQSTTSSGESEHEEAKTPSSESTTAPAGGQAPVESSTPAAAQAAPGNAGGSAEPSGGTQAQSPGK